MEKEKIGHEKTSRVIQQGKNEVVSIADNRSNTNYLSTEASKRFVENKNLTSKCQFLIQRTARKVSLEDYTNAYNDEIQRTNTMKPLNIMYDNYIKNNDQFLVFTDRYSFCGVNVDKQKTGFKQVQSIKIPEPQETKTAQEIPYNLGNSISRRNMNKIFAIHELEHLRIMYENITQHPYNTVGEPLRANLVTGDNNEYKNSICEQLARIIPTNLNDVEKLYISERLDYIKKPFPYGSDTENNTARDFTTVLIELIKFCELNPLNLSYYKSQLEGCYEALTLRHL